ncbi:hypothetical protein CEXT_61491 [Caerostris extrusa]|uniref:Uncharacterized protein n=1 Tax=Caerostris extrusa TaxID=172846 RepID=A0AAV4NXT3_CAEEX|nr:hypothetical protein CEXT_61491 [Caerostris extrusa]
MHIEQSWSNSIRENAETLCYPNAFRTRMRIPRKHSERKICFSRLHKMEEFRLKNSFSFFRPLAGREKAFLFENESLSKKERFLINGGKNSDGIMEGIKSWPEHL